MCVIVPRRAALLSFTLAIVYQYLLSHRLKTFILKVLHILYCKAMSRAYTSFELGAWVGVLGENLIQITAGPRYSQVMSPQSITLAQVPYRLSYPTWIH